MCFSIAFRSITIAATASVAALALVLTTPSRASAQTFYSDLTSFNAAATTSTLYDFEGIVPRYDIAVDPAVLKVPAPGRITFSTSGEDTNIYVSNAAYYGSGWSINGTDSVMAGFNSSVNLPTTTISLDGLYNAFAIELGQTDQFTNNYTNNYTIGLYNGNTQIGTDVVTGTVATGYFYGVTSSTAFDNIRVTTTQANRVYTLFDNARVGSAVVSNAVPEAGTLALVFPAIGIVGTVLVRRRIRK